MLEIARVLEGQLPGRGRGVLLRDWAGPWFERIAAQVELGRMSPLTYSKYEGDWRLHLELSPSGVGASRIRVRTR